MTDLIREAAKRHMLHMMKDISEQCYCAGWMSNLEYDLWCLCHQESGPGYGMLDLEDMKPALQQLRGLAEELGGWWMWNPADDYSWEDRCIWVPLDEWKHIYAEHVTR